MRKLLNDQFWYQFLKDVIQEESHCSQNFLGVDHVDFPALMGKILLFLLDVSICYIVVHKSISILNIGPLATSIVLISKNK